MDLGRRIKGEGSSPGDVGGVGGADMALAAMLDFASRSRSYMLKL